MRVFPVITAIGVGAVIAAAEEGETPGRKALENLGKEINTVEDTVVPCLQLINRQVEDLRKEGSDVEVGVGGEVLSADLDIDDLKPGSYISPAQMGENLSNKVTTSDGISMGGERVLAGQVTPVKQSDGTSLFLLKTLIDRYFVRYLVVEPSVVRFAIKGGEYAFVINDLKVVIMNDHNDGTSGRTVSYTELADETLKADKRFKIDIQYKMKHLRPPMIVDLDEMSSDLRDQVQMSANRGYLLQRGRITTRILENVVVKLKSPDDSDFYLIRLEKGGYGVIGTDVKCRESGTVITDDTHYTSEIKTRYTFWASDGLHGFRYDESKEGAEPITANSLYMEVLAEEALDGNHRTACPRLRNEASRLNKTVSLSDIVTKALDYCRKTLER